MCCCYISFPLCHNARTEQYKSNLHVDEYTATGHVLNSKFCFFYSTLHFCMKLKCSLWTGSLQWFSLCLSLSLSLSPHIQSNIKYNMCVHLLTRGSGDKFVLALFHAPQLGIHIPYCRNTFIGALAKLLTGLLASSCL